MRHLTPAFVLALTLTACTTAPATDDGTAVADPAPEAERDPAVPSPRATVPPSPAATPVPTPSAAPVPTPVAPRATEVLAARDVSLRFTHPWAPAAGADELAATIVVAEQAARDRSLPSEHREAAAFEAQFAYRQLAASPAWLDDVLAALPAELHAAARGNVAARAALDRLLAERDEPPTALPAWRIVTPAPADDLVRHYRDAAEEIGVAWEYLAAINLVETRMGRIRGYSTAGARGPMQFIPESWEIFGAGGDIDDPRDSIFAAARHLEARDWDEGPRAALLRYNRSSNYADAVTAYAEVLRQDPDAYDTYHGWQVLYSTGPDLFVLPVGYEEPDPVPLDEYRRRPVVAVTG